MTRTDANTPALKWAPEWKPDMLGPGFEQAIMPLGEDPDTGKSVRAVLVRAVDGGDHASVDKPPLLWVHGLSDYFFQEHVAEHFVNQGYPFYALDLRRCGRARTRGQRWHYTLDMANYFPELTTALDYITAAHGPAVIMAHSTGGLIAPLWADHLRRTDPATHAKLRGIVLNSPWLDLQYSPLVVALARPVINTVGKLFPLLPLPGGKLGTYGKSIHVSEHGEWKFDTEMKPLTGHRKYFGWLRAVNKGQQQIHKGEIDTGVPTLTLVSSHSYLGKEYSPAADTADTVLDVEQIRKWAPSLTKAAHSEVRTIDGARHDVFLSEPFARDVAFKATDEWLQDLPAHP